ncbi:MAG: bacillithiol system redox-active protein YtxJ [Cyclobacteriaceae bacterium]|nr:bacillithiol system redox-active protein YtxJ [Cyclobacteriaceae bacterium]
MNWNALTNSDQLQLLIKESAEQPVLIFKHSTSCSISRAVLDRIERNWSTALTHVKPYYLDLLTYRPVSNQVASVLNIEHESPQAIVLYHGSPIYVQSHFSIDINGIKSALPTPA